MSAKIAESSFLVVLFLAKYAKSCFVFTFFSAGAQIGENIVPHSLVDCVRTRTCSSWFAHVVETPHPCAVFTDSCASQLGTSIRFDSLGSFPFGMERCMHFKAFLRI